jgi:biotin carboxyl carrier protein
VETIRELNGLADAQHLWVGQDLFLPADPAQPSPALPEGPVTAIETRPQPAAQGETVEVRVEVGDQVAYCPAAESCIDLDLRLGDQAIPLLPDGPDRYWGLIAIHPLTGPGYVWLDLSWRRETGSPDTGAIRWPVPVADGDYPTYDIVLPPGKGDLLDPELVQAEFEKLQALWGAPETPVAWQRRFQRPISPDYLTSAPFGQRRSYNSGPVTSYHSGQDFAAPEGAEVHAPAPGTVVLAEPLLVRGNAVVIDHGAGVFSGYWHLSSIAVTAGQQVNTGDLLGLVGTTGLSTGNHLHWELRLHSVPVSPLQWVDTRFP